MEKNQKILVVFGLFACIVLFLVLDIYAAMIGAIVVIALAMSFQIMNETGALPDVVVRLKDDAKGFHVINRGNAKALRIHIALVPLNLEYDVPELPDEKSVTFPIDHMLEEAKAVVTFENEKGERFSKNFMLNALGEDEEDLLKPVFPLFHWK